MINNRKNGTVTDPTQINTRHNKPAPLTENIRHEKPNRQTNIDTTNPIDIMNT